MKITFLMGRSGHYPCGGHKVVYEYANGLCRRGHRVTVIHPTTSFEYESSIHRIKIYYNFMKRWLGMEGGYRPDSWFEVDPGVKLKWVPSLREAWIPNADVIVATAWQTAEWVDSYQDNKGQKFYLIQAWETVFFKQDPQRVLRTYSFPLKKIVIAKWLGEKLKELGQDCFYNPNGLDFQKFGLDNRPENRHPSQVMMLYHVFDWKGTSDGIRAVSLAREQIPDITLTMFGVYERPDNLPSWVEYYQTPEQKLLRRLYNEAAIFINASWVEGWGLTPCEAAQCGAALCITDNGGHREFAIHEETALLSPPKDVNSQAENILRLIKDPDLRINLARQAHAYVQRFTWNNAVLSMEKIFQ
jgi:glycosyltransferase involved in cell wall biosynthesis